MPGELSPGPWDHPRVSNFKRLNPNSDFRSITSRVQQKLQHFKEKNTQHNIEHHVPGNSTWHGGKHIFQTPPPTKWKVIGLVWIKLLLCILIVSLTFHKVSANNNKSPTLSSLVAVISQPDEDASLSELDFEDKPKIRIMIQALIKGTQGRQTWETYSFSFFCLFPLT